MADLIADMDVEELWAGNVDAKPVDIDWQEAYGENYEGWRVVAPGDLQCDECRKVFETDDECPRCEGEGQIEKNAADIEVDGYTTEDLYDECTVCDGSGVLTERGSCPSCSTGTLREYDAVENGDEPMMNYYYPLDSLRYGERETARRIEEAHLAVVLIELENDGYVLALSGGGMDLSWDICRAYMAAGYLPPVHFCDLPRFAGDYTDSRKLNTIRACIKACDVMMNYTSRTREKLYQLAPVLNPQEQASV